MWTVTPREAVEAIGGRIAGQLSGAIGPTKEVHIPPTQQSSQ